MNVDIGDEMKGKMAYGYFSDLRGQLRDLLWERGKGSEGKRETEEGKVKWRMKNKGEGKGEIESGRGTGEGKV